MATAKSTSKSGTKSTGTRKRTTRKTSASKTAKTTASTTTESSTIIPESTLVGDAIDNLASVGDFVLGTTGLGDNSPLNSDAEIYNQQINSLVDQGIPITPVANIPSSPISSRSGLGSGGGRQTRTARRTQATSGQLSRIENEAVTHVNGSLGQISIASLPDVNSYLPTDFHQVSSAIPQTDLDIADEAVLAVKKQRATAKIIKENAGLFNDVLGIKDSFAKIAERQLKYATSLEKINAAIANLGAAQEGTNIAEINLNSRRTEREHTQTLSSLIAQKQLAQQLETRAKTAEMEARASFIADASNFNVGDTLIDVNTVEI